MTIPRKRTGEDYTIIIIIIIIITTTIRRRRRRRAFLFRIELS